MTTVFTPGTVLSGAFYRQVVQPILHGHPHVAALLGWGSDVLGYDSERSVDHGWGPRLLVFLPDAERLDEWTERLERELPESFQNWPVRYGWDAVPVRHWVTVTTISTWCDEYLGLDPTAGLTPLDWLLIPQQRLLGVVAGEVYADGVGDLTELRSALAWYPDDLWRWLLACQWRRIAQEEAFVARAAEAGDDSGSAITAARQACEIMRLALLLQKRYAPYQKWLGTAFAGLEHTDDLPAQLAAALHARDGERRQHALAGAYRSIAIRQNGTHLAGALDPEVRRYYNRPAQVLMAERFVDACVKSVDDPWLRSLPLIGTVDQAVDCHELLQKPELFRRLAILYR